MDNHYETNRDMNLKIDHIALRCTDIETVKNFFTEIIGLTVGHRPPFPFPGYWLYADQKAVLHLFGGGFISPENGNIVDHIAFWSDDYERMMSLFLEHNLDFSETIIPESNIRQLFVRAPENLIVEIDFPENTSV